MAMGTLGGELKRKERVSARLGDVLSQLYLASSALKRYQDEGRQHADLPLLHWALQDALFKAQEAIDELLRNFPNRWIGLALRVIVLPLGRDLKRPSDKLDSQVARLLQTPSETRSRLAQGQYLTREEGNPFGLLEQALDDVLSAEPLFEKVCKADGIKRPFMQLDKVARSAWRREYSTRPKRTCCAAPKRAACTPSTSMILIPSTWWPTRHCSSHRPITEPPDRHIDSQTPPMWRRFYGAGTG